MPASSDASSSIAASLALALALLLPLAVLAVPASAQQADVSVSSNVSQAPNEAQAGSSIEVDTGVELRIEGFTCSQEIEVPVNVTMAAEVSSDAPANASVTTSNNTAEFPVPSTPYYTEGYEQTTTATVQATPQSGVSEDYNVSLAVQAVFEGATYDSCVPSEFSPAESNITEIDVLVRADEQPDDGDGDQTGNDTSDLNETPGNGSDEQAGEDGNGIPLGPLAAPLAFSLSGWVLHRTGRGPPGSR